MYDKYSLKAEDFINDEEIKDSIAWAEENKGNLELINQILDRSADHKGLTIGKLFCCCCVKTQTSFSGF